MGSDDVVNPMLKWTNLWAILFMIPLIVMISGGLLLLLLYPGNTTFWISIPTTLIIVWLVIELIINSFIVVTLQNRVLTIRKPLRPKSLLSRKKHHELVIHPDDWEELYYWLFKGGSAYYFRKDHCAMYIFGSDGFENLSKRLRDHFPDKHIASYNDRFPRKIKSELKAKYPERVL